LYKAGVNSLDYNISNQTSKVIDAVPDSIMGTQAKENLKKPIASAISTITQFVLFKKLMPEKAAKIKNDYVQGVVRNVTEEIKNYKDEPLPPEKVAEITQKEDQKAVDQIRSEATPIELKSIPPDTKLGDLLEYAKAQGWEYKGVEEQVPVTGKIRLYPEEAKPKKEIQPQKLFYGGTEFNPEKQVKGEVKPTETTKTTGVAKTIEAKAIEDKIVSQIEDKAQYEPGTFEEWSKSATELVNNDIERARAIVRGEESVPGDINEPFLIEAMQEYARITKDPEIIYELANSPLATEIAGAAQKLGGTRIIKRDSAYKDFQELKSFREKEVVRGTKQTAKTVARTLKEGAKIKGEDISIDKLAKFIDEITC
jgi:hypothetical protein